MRLFPLPREKHQWMKKGRPEELYATLEVEQGCPIPDDAFLDEIRGVFMRSGIHTPRKRPRKNELFLRISVGFHSVQQPYFLGRFDIHFAIIDDDLDLLLHAEPFGGVGLLTAHDILGAFRGDLERAIEVYADVNGLSHA